MGRGFGEDGQGLYSNVAVAALCGAWTLAWFLLHHGLVVCLRDPYESDAPEGENQSNGGASGQSRPARQVRGTYQRRLWRSQLYNMLAVVGGAYLLFGRCRDLPKDLLYDFVWPHQVLFSMAVGHWANALWEDIRTWRFLAIGLDAEAVFGAPTNADPNLALGIAYVSHHIVTLAAYLVCLGSGKLGAEGALGLLFEAPVLLMNHREILLMFGSSQQQAMFRRLPLLSLHWKLTFGVFAVVRGGASILYFFSVRFWMKELGELDGPTVTAYHIFGIFFTLLNFRLWFLLCAWQNQDTLRARAVHTGAMSAPKASSELELGIVREDASSSAEGVRSDVRPLSDFEIRPGVLETKDGESEAGGGELWVAIDGAAYDVTRFLDEHPGVVSNAAQ